jgi:hypothetical protein
MIFLVVVIALGITHKQDKHYWVLAAGASATQLLAHILFNGCGSLENRGFDGYVTTYVRQATSDGTEVLWIFPFAMVLGWVLPIYMVSKGYIKKSKKSLQDNISGSVRLTNTES